MRSRDDLWQLGKRPIKSRFLFEDIEPCAGDDSGFNRAAKRGFVDELAASRVDEAQAWLALREAAVVEQMPCIFRGRQMERNVIGRRAQLIERHELDAGSRGQIGRN